MPGATTYAIHPALGIARLGNAPADPTDPTTWYLGAEAPYEVPNQGKPYKVGGKIKKQAQRFRIYELQGGKAVREITLEEDDVTDISWTVHVANRKAALKLDEPLGSVSRPAVSPPPVFTVAEGPPAPSNYWPAKTRNEDAKDRAELCIDPGPQAVSRAEPRVTLQGSITFVPETGGPVSKAVGLGMLFSEPDTGRLLVFAGDGTSEGVLDGRFSPLRKIKDWGNNDLWYDDTCDGWVAATITFRDGSTVSLDQPDQRAWVICTAPRYAPAFNQFTTLYDVALSVISMPSGDVPRPSFAKDVFPILRSVAQLEWVSARGSFGHAPGRGGYYLAASRLSQVSSNDANPDSDAYKARQGVLARVRNPNVNPPLAGIQKQMPQLSHDIDTKRKPYEISVVTHLQYALLRKWAAGDFDADGVPAYVPLERLDVADQPHALDVATLENSAGTPFYPGIESWRIMAAPELYAGLLRIGHAEPGDLTIGNALPWQADFLDCNDIWWPIQRPNEVARDGKALRPWVPKAWMPTEDQADYNKMVEGWWRLGFVVSKDDGATYEDVEGSAEGSGP